MGKSEQRDTRDLMLIRGEVDILWILFLYMLWNLCWAWETSGRRRAAMGASIEEVRVRLLGALCAYPLFQTAGTR